MVITGTLLIMREAFHGEMAPHVLDSPLLRFLMNGA